MKRIYLHVAGGIALTFAIAGCIPRAPEPLPAPAPVATPAPTPAPTPVPPPTVTQPVYDNWMDAPRTPGDWTYRPEQGGSAILYGEPASDAVFVMRCDRSQRTVYLDRAGESSGERPMRIRTETMDSTLSARPIGEQLPYMRASVPASSSLLEAMAFSKGRFAVNVEGLPPLYLPAWPEVTRVIEDCR